MSTPLPRIAFLHTAKIHIETFDRLLAEHVGQVELQHTVRPDWLERAQREGLSGDLRTAVSRHLEEMSTHAAVVVCTCSTLGPIADEIAAAGAPVFRIDRPMIEAAVRCDGTCVVAVCLESTIDPTSQLLEDAYREAGRKADYEITPCLDAWPHFEAGDLDAFAAAIANSLRVRLGRGDRVGCIVLAQASMARAEPLLAEVGVPVLSSPALAATEALARSLAR
ncbi:MAG: hypothetical protein P8R42_01925 [Candidatus Binatia bacterium]|nr:hypothetical protein [Candidatus Binatia bacterium]